MLKEIDSLYCLISEENTNIIELNENGHIVVAFDLLDGSSNIDANINVGSIFGIYYKPNNILDFMF